MLKHSWTRLSILATLIFVLSSCQLSPTPNNQPNPSPSPVTETPDVDVPPTVATLKWSDASSWASGQVPSAGQTIEIPKGKAVLLDVSPPALKGLTINGTLVFGDTDINLTADWIMVHGEGRLELGTPTKPYTHKAVITLTGADEDVMGMKMGGRVLGVMGGGTLSMIGQERKAWTKLNATAKKGDKTITLADATDWQVGDSIVIASTDFDYEQAEKFTIQSVAGNKVTLDKALAYMHYGELQSYNGKTLDERAEVGLLSRNIVIKGASATDRFGGHVMVMDNSQAVVDSVEFVNMGQENKMGRYPIHWHRMGDGSRGQYATAAFTTALTGVSRFTAATA